MCTRTLLVCIPPMLFVCIRMLLLCIRMYPYVSLRYLYVIRMLDPCDVLHKIDLCEFGEKFLRERCFKKKHTPAPMRFVISTKPRIDNRKACVFSNFS